MDGTCTLKSMKHSINNLLLAYLFYQSILLPLINRVIVQQQLQCTVYYSLFYKLTLVLSHYCFCLHCISFLKGCQLFIELKIKKGAIPKNVGNMIFTKILHLVLDLSRVLNSFYLYMEKNLRFSDLRLTLGGPLFVVS